MDDPLYREEILEHYRSSPRRGHLAAPDLAADLDNPFCGDHIRLELEHDDRGRISRVRFDGRGCAISQAATSILAEHVEGLSLDEARRLSADDVLRWLAIPLSPTRLKCGLLGWRVLRQALAGAAKAR